MKISLHGSYFGDNFGDTLFVEFFISWIEELYNDEDKIEIALPFAGKRIQNLYKKRISDKRGFKALYESDKVIFIGGGYLGEQPKNRFKWNLRFLIRHASVILFSLIFNKKIAFIGVGAGPLNNYLVRKITVKACNESEFFVVRDNESREYLISYGAHPHKIITTVDSILSISSKYLEDENRKLQLESLPIDSKKMRIGIHIPGTGDNEQEVLKVVYEDLNLYLNDNGVLESEVELIFFIDFYKPNYEYYAYELAKNFFADKEYIITSYSYSTPDNLIAFINTLDLVFTTKLHCGIVANCLNKYTVSLALHPKTARLYKQLNLADRSKPLEDYAKGDVVTLLEDFKIGVNSYNNVSPKIIHKANINKEIVHEFIVGGTVQ